MPNRGDGAGAETSPYCLRWTILTILLAFALHIGQSARYNSVAGPFRIIPGHVEKCPAELEPKLPLVFYYRGTRDRRQRDLWYYDANFTTLYTFDDNHTADVNVASWSSMGGWKDNAYVVVLPRLCTAFKMTIPSLWRQFMVATHGDPNAFCPFPPGTYFVRNVTTDFNLKTVPTFFYGKWRLTLRMLRTRDKETMACLRVFADTVPKTSNVKVPTSMSGNATKEGEEKESSTTKSQEDQ